jgi:fucose 4-O-acetylase-like acetyltransferase
VVLAAAWQLLDADTWFGVRPLLGLCGIGFGATVAVVLDRVPKLGPALARLGQQTLPVYVLHLPLVALVHLVSQRVVPTGDLALAAAYPVAVTALVVAACLALHRAALRAGWGWLFTLPRSSRVGSPHGSGHGVAA